MKFSVCLAIAALTLSVGAYAQTSQTFHFGEGQTGMSSGNTHAAPAPQAPKAQPAPLPQSAEQPAPLPPKAKPKHTTTHHKHHRAHAKKKATYAHN